MYFWCIRPIIW